MLIALALHALVLVGWRLQPDPAPLLPSKLVLRFSTTPAAPLAPVAPSTPAEPEPVVQPQPMPAPAPAVPATLEPVKAAETARPAKTEAPDPAPAVPELVARTEPADGSLVETVAQAASVRYEQALAAWLDRHKYYPASLRRRGLEGEGVLRVQLARDGHVLGLESFAPLPDSLLDRVAMDWVRRADPFPPMPDEIPGDAYSIRFPVRFSLD